MQDQDEKGLGRQAPFPIRFHPGVKEAADKRRREQDRSMNWVINDLLKEALGLKVAA